jgi:hypothetical protein
MFLDDYPGVVLSDRVLPSVAYLHVIKQQCAQKAWEWIPWRRIVSEEHALQKRTNAQRGSLWIWLKFWRRLQGLLDQTAELEVGPSPFRLQNLLMVRANAFAFCNTGQLKLRNAYVNSFIEAYTRHVPEGFRPPSVCEAEEADRRVLLEVFRLVYKGWSMDSALQSVFGERDLFRQYLVCMPRAVKKQQPIPAKGKHSGRTRRELDSPPLKRRKQICFDHEKGKCHRGDACKFSHELARNSTGAGR